MLWSTRLPDLPNHQMTPIRVEPGLATDTALWELTYYSTAAFSHSDDELAHLQEQAEPRNRALGLTGILVHWKQSFFQVLEGPRAAIETVFYDNIVPSQRHTGIVGVRMGTQPARTFPDWQMAVAQPNEPGMAAVETLADDYRSGRHLTDARTVGTVLLKSFIICACAGGE